MIALIITVTNSLDLATISTVAQSTPKSNNISAINSVTIGDNLVLFSALSNLSPNNPHPIKSQCFNYGFVANNKPLGNLLIIKYRNDGKWYSDNRAILEYRNSSRHYTGARRSVKVGLQCTYFYKIYRATKINNAYYRNKYYTRWSRVK